MTKTPGGIIILHKCIRNHDHIVPEIWRLTDVIFIFHFEQFFGLLHHQKWKIFKIKKKAIGDIIIKLYTTLLKRDSDTGVFLRISEILKKVFFI